MAHQIKPKMSFSRSDTRREPEALLREIHRLENNGKILVKDNELLRERMVTIYHELDALEGVLAAKVLHCDIHGVRVPRG